MNDVQQKRETLTRYYIITLCLYDSEQIKREEKRQGGELKSTGRELYET